MGLAALSAAAIVTGAAGCSSASRTNLEGAQEAGEMNTSSQAAQRNKDQTNSSKNLVIVDVKAQPEYTQLDENFGVTRTVKVFADVKSFLSSLEKVTLKLTPSAEMDDNLKFFTGPLEIPMKHLGGTTWKAELSDEVLKALAISGEHLKFDGNVVAVNKKGDIAVSGAPVDVIVESPPLVAAG